MNFVLNFLPQFQQRQMEEQLQMINQIREHSEEPERQMRIELEETRQTLNELYGICDAQRARITELEKSKTIVRELEQQIRELKEANKFGLTTNFCEYFLPPILEAVTTHAQPRNGLEKDAEGSGEEGSRIGLHQVDQEQPGVGAGSDAEFRWAAGRERQEGCRVGGGQSATDPGERSIAEGWHWLVSTLGIIHWNSLQNQSALIDQHTKEINSLQQALKAKDSKNNNCMTPQRTSSSSLSSAMKNPNLTPSMRVVFTPYRSKMESKISASVEELSTANGGGDSTLLGTTTTASQEDSGNQDDRLAIDGKKNIYKFPRV
jgi:hypothetical protein